MPLAECTVDVLGSRILPLTLPEDLVRGWTGLDDGVGALGCIWDICEVWVTEFEIISGATMC
jgi:hypothetical protein